MAELDIRNLAKRYGDFYAVRDVSLSRSPTASSSCCWAPRAAARPRRCAWSRASSSRPPATSRWAAATSPLLPPWKRNAGMVFQSYALFPHLTVAQNVAFGLEMRKLPKAEIDKRVEEALRAGAARRLRRAPAAPALGRPAAAGGARPRARHPARRAAARRAALEPRRQAAPGGAGRDPRAAAQARPHHRDGDPRPGGGAHHGRPAGGDERGLGPPGRQPARPLRAAGHPLRGGLRRPQHLPRRHRRGARPLPDRRRAHARLHRRHAGPRRAVACGPSGSKSPPHRSADSTTACPVRWNSFPISAR